MAEYSYESARAPTVEVDREAVAVRSFFIRVYGWMCAGLAATGAVAYSVSESESMTRAVFGNPGVFYGLMVLEIVIVAGIYGLVSRMPATVAGLAFFGYAALNGVTLAAIFLIYTRESIASTFLISAGTFGATSLFGALTKRDLSSWGSMLGMGVLGLFIASIVNIFFASAAIYWATTYIGVVVFVALAAYDTQQLKGMALAGDEWSEAGRKTAILGALSLYLDFVNLFIYMLRLLGGRRRD